MRFGIAFAMLFVLRATAVLQAEEPRSAAHQAYAKWLWDYVTKTVDYRKWKQSEEAKPLDLGPPCCPNAVTYLQVVTR